MRRAVWDLDYGGCLALAEKLGEPKFRGKQLYGAIVSGTPIERASNLPKPFREAVAERFDTGSVEIAEILTGKDGTEKLLYRLRDGNVVEGVFMRYRYGNTLCLSTQVGCRMNCAFCASGLDGLVRNLTAGEMLGEVAAVNRKERAGKGESRAVTNLVLMGSGEPLDNYEEVLKFLRLVSNPDGLGISPRNVSLSTCGLVPEIDRLSGEGLPLNLTISLHAADDSRRARLMPIDKRYPIAEVLSAARRYFDKTGRRIHIEYSLIDGENAGEDSARLLAKLLKGMNCHVNLIRLNPVRERGKRPASAAAVERFRRVLEESGISVTIRRSMGADVEGACGQLRRRFLAETDGKAARTCGERADGAEQIAVGAEKASVGYGNPVVPKFADREIPREKPRIAQSPAVPSGSSESKTEGGETGEDGNGIAEREDRSGRIPKSAEGETSHEKQRIARNSVSESKNEGVATEKPRRTEQAGAAVRAGRTEKSADEPNAEHSYRKRGAPEKNNPGFADETEEKQGRADGNEGKPGRSDGKEGIPGSTDGNEEKPGRADKNDAKGTRSSAPRGGAR